MVCFQLTALVSRIPLGGWGGGGSDEPCSRTLLVATLTKFRLLLVLSSTALEKNSECRYLWPFFISVYLCVYICVYTGLGNETGKFQNIKKNRYMNFLSVYWS